MLNGILAPNKFLTLTTEDIHSSLYYNSPAPLNELEKQSSDILLPRNKMDGSSFLEEKKDRKRIYTTEIFAFGFYNGSNIGSARHLNTSHYQIKGAGRNQLAIRDDYKHSWGGMEAFEAFREFCLAKLISLYDKELVIPYLNIGKYNDQLDSYFLIRDYDLPRVSQLSPYNMSEHEIAGIRGRLELRRLPTATSLLEIHIRNYLKALELGIFQTQLTIENVTLDGRILDVGSLACTHLKDAARLPHVRLNDRSTVHHLALFRRNLEFAILPIANIIYKENLDKNQILPLFENILNFRGYSSQEKNYLINSFHENDSSSHDFDFHFQDIPFNQEVEARIVKKFTKWEQFKTIEAELEFEFWKKFDLQELITVAPFQFIKTTTKKLLSSQFSQMTILPTGSRKRKIETINSDYDFTVILENSHDIDQDIKKSDKVREEFSFNADVVLTNRKQIKQLNPLNSYSSFIQSTIAERCLAQDQDFYFNETLWRLTSIKSVIKALHEWDSISQRKKSKKLSYLWNSLLPSPLENLNSSFSYNDWRNFNIIQDGKEKELENLDRKKLKDLLEKLLLDFKRESFDWTALTGPVDEFFQEKLKTTNEKEAFFEALEEEIKKHL